jgi:hypothetical protein
MPKKKTPMTQTYYHARHVCGHAVFWSDPAFAVTASDHPCPWCGGETGESKPPPNVLCVADALGLVCFRALNPDGTAPIPGREGEPIILQHRADEWCCREHSSITPAIARSLHLHGFRLDGDDNEANLLAALKREGVARPAQALRDYFASYPVSDELLRAIFG